MSNTQSLSIFDASKCPVVTKSGSADAFSNGVIPIKGNTIQCPLVLIARPANTFSNGVIPIKGNTIQYPPVLIACPTDAFGEGVVSVGRGTVSPICVPLLTKLHSNATR
jgi:hypothetical protein